VIAISKFRSAAASALITKGNAFLLLAISPMRLFGNEDRHSQRLAHLQIAKVFAVQNNRGQALAIVARAFIRGRK